MPIGDFSLDVLTLGDFCILVIVGTLNSGGNNGLPLLSEEEGGLDGSLNLLKSKRKLLLSGLCSLAFLKDEHGEDVEGALYMNDDAEDTGGVVEYQNSACISSKERLLGGSGTDGEGRNTEVEELDEDGTTGVRKSGFSCFGTISFCSDIFNS